MAEDRPAAASRVLLTFASLVVVVAGLRAAAPILVPVFLGFFFALLSLPLADWLERRGVRRGLAIAVTVLAGAAVVAVAGLFVTASLGELAQALPIYQVRLQRTAQTVVGWLQSRGFLPPGWSAAELFRAAPLVDLLSGTVKGVAALLTDAVLVLLTMVFTLLEASGLREKVVAALGQPRAERRRFARVAREVQRYLGIKTAVSLLTGILIGVWVAIVGLDFPLLWGFLAFLFHYVPNIGAILASVPAVVLGMVQFGVGGATMVGVGYLVVNMVLGNFLEPQLLGRRLGLSPLVVFLSLVFWGWTWGPIGMFLSVPLTMAAKILLEATPRLAWVAILLGPNPSPVAGEPAVEETGV
jgi:predicted PurR-regulated permease PerM